MKRPYVSGPIAGGTQNLSREEKLARFARAELVLRNDGYEPVNPLSIEACPTQDCNLEAVGDKKYREDGQYWHTWECYLRYDLIAMLKDADGIALLPEWETSPGAVLEHHVAVGLGWETIDLTKNAVVLGLPLQLERARAGQRV